MSNYILHNGFHLADLIITRLKDNMTCYKLEGSHNPLQDLLSSMNTVISTNERAWILTGHVTFDLRYNQIYQIYQL